MKFILFFALLLLSVRVFCQVTATDSTKQLTLAQLNQGIEYMKMNLDKSHRQFITGAYISIGGVVVCGLASLITPDSEDKIKEDNQQKAQLTILAIGSAAALVGCIVMIDSHKYISRAGRWRFDGSKLTVDF